MKLYAKQVNPEYQESPMMLDCDVIDSNDIAMYGNEDYNSHMPDLFKTVVDTVEHDPDNIIFEMLRHASTDRELIEEVFQPVNKLRFSEADIAGIAYFLKDNWTNPNPDDADCIVHLMTLITGHEWSTKVITGATQGEWQRVYYDSEVWSRKDLEFVENEYFNLGTQWDVVLMRDEDEKLSQEDMDFADPEYCYTHDGATNLDAKYELADDYGVDPADVTLYRIKGYKTVCVYEEMK